MALADNIEVFTKLPIQHKVLAFVFVSAFLGVIFYFLIYSDLADKEKSLNQQMTQLQAEKTTFEEKKRKYLEFRAEVQKLLEARKDLLKVLPTESEIHTLLQSIHAQAMLAGLNILTFEQQPEIREQYYAKIPVKLVISGSYHQVNRFFYAVGRLKRIVNIQSLELETPDKAQAEPTQSVLLKASFLASTFRFLATEQPQAAPPAGGAPAAAPQG